MHFLQITIIGRILGSRSKSISIFRTSFPKFSKIICMLCIISTSIVKYAFY